MEVKGKNVQSLIIGSRRGLIWIKESPKKSDVKLHQHLGNVNIGFTKTQRDMDIFEKHIPELLLNQLVPLMLADNEHKPPVS